jgi:hypothetical protein
MEEKLKEFKKEHEKLLEEGRKKKSLEKIKNQEMF